MAWKHVITELQAGHQAYVVCPLVGGGAAEEEGLSDIDADADADMDDAGDLDDAGAGCRGDSDAAAARVGRRGDSDPDAVW